MNFFFYDLETSGVKPRTSRIMQFAGQRTDMDLKPIGKPYNALIKLTDDILPDPEAILVTGITPQKTIQEGISEHEFTGLFYREVFKPDTVFVGFNNIRFDDEFMRFLFWRNFADSYEWQWKDGCSRWDILDLSRMTRALRPEGIKWPFDSAQGKPSNRLELLTSINKLPHVDAHDAMSDVNATIAIASLIKQKQPKLFDYLFNMRGKTAAKNLVDTGKPFIYTSGKYPGEHEKTTIVAHLCDHPDRNGSLVYDLRANPGDYSQLSPEALAKKWSERNEDEKQRFPVKALQYNRCPAISPIGVLDKKSAKRIKIDQKEIDAHFKLLKESKADFAEKILKALEIINAERKTQTEIVANLLDVDRRLYDGFVADKDRLLAKRLQTAKPEELSNLASRFADARLKLMVLLYKARNFPGELTAGENVQWQKYKKDLLMSPGSNNIEKYMQRVDELAAQNSSNKHIQFLLEELKLWAEGILPENL